MEGANPSSTTFPASRRRVQWSCPSGAGLQAKAMRWASPLWSNFLGRLGLGFSFNAPSRPPCAKRRLVRKTVPTERSNASATLGALHPSSIFRRMRARAVSRAELLPLRTSCCNCSLSLGARRTRYSSLPITTTLITGSTHFTNENELISEVVEIGDVD